MNITEEVLTKRRIGFFGGTFDPPHHGHIHLVVSLQERYQLDEVWIVPAFQNPLKPSHCSPFHRFRMAELAFTRIPGCVVLDVESFREGASYTIDTVRSLIETYPIFGNASRFLLLGADIINTLHECKEVDELFRLVQPLVAARGACVVEDPLIREGWADTGLLDISSTDVRERLARGQYVEHLVPPRVVRYIRENRLYGVV